jgi:diguanylate cyclase (GGDEF)-like protein
MKRHLWVLFILVMLTGCNMLTTYPEEGPVSVSGEIDLTESEMLDDPLVQLKGDWLLYWNQLLQPKDIESGAGKLTGYIDMPSNWYKHTVNGEYLPRTGYATFALDLKISDYNEVKGLIIPVMYSNYKLWIDDQLVAMSGEVGMDRLNSVPQKLTKVVYFQARSEQVRMLLQISNYHNYAGGMVEPIVYGTAIAVQNEHDGNAIVQYILLGMILLSGIYHICLSLFRKKDSSVLLFGLFCLMIAIRNTMTGDVVLTQVFPNFPWAIAMKIEYISLYLMLPLLALFIRKLFPEDSSERITKLCVAIAIIYILVTLVLNGDVYYRFLLIFQIYMVIALIYALSTLIRATLRKKIGAVFALVGFSIVTLTATFDIFSFVFKYSGQSVNPLGVAAFIVCFSFVLSKKQSVSFKMTEQLARELTELNEDLDKKVYERTLDMEESQKKLEELNIQLQEWSMVDGLTGVSNRRHFDDYLSSQLILSTQDDTPLTLLMIDLDNFKLYNDNYGHIQGDFCLQEVVQAIKLSLSLQEGLVARYGGEEFAVVLPNCSKEDSIIIAQKLCAVVQQLQIPHTMSEVADVVTISIGATTMSSEADKKYKKLIHSADQNLYKAKREGKNQVYVG